MVAVAQDAYLQTYKATRGVQFVYIDEKGIVVVDGRSVEIRGYYPRKGRDLGVLEVTLGITNKWRRR